MRWRFGRFANWFSFFEVMFFSSPELKARELFWSLVVRRLSVRPSVCLSVHFLFSSPSPYPLSQFQPNLAQSILGWREWSLFKRRAHPFPRADNYEIAKIHWKILKISSSPEPLGQLNLAQSILGWMGFNFVQTFPRRDINGIAKIHWWKLKIFFSRTTEPISTNLAQYILG